MWKAFWANSGHKSLQKSSASLKQKLLDKACKPVLAHRCARWPPQPQVATALDRMQTKMMAVLLRTVPNEGESPADYCRRRNQIAAKECRARGQWSKFWYLRSVAWDDHLERAHCPESWPTQLRSVNDATWLDTLRALNGGGRTRTRVCRGRPAMRWSDGIDHAQRSAAAL